jgi:2-haloalkanoic acid dehalogenase type II
MKRLTDYRVLTFDCYGTLIDWEAGIWAALQPVIRSHDGADPTREEALRAFARFEGHHERATPDLAYPDLLARVHRDLAESFGMRTDRALDADFGNSVPRWPAFPDSAAALRVLHRHFRLVILSNVHREGIAASARQLGAEFDALYTAQDIGAYKPSDTNFQYLIDHLEADFGLERQDVLHTAQSLHHDHLPANRFGLASAWIDRQRLSDGGSWGATAKVADMPRLDFTFFTLGEMAEAVVRETV